MLMEGGDTIAMSLDECLSRKEAPVAGSLWNADLSNQMKGPPA